MNEGAQNARLVRGDRGGCGAPAPTRAGILAVPLQPLSATRIQHVMPAPSLPPPCHWIRAFAATASRCAAVVVIATAALGLPASASAQSSAIYELAFRGTWSVDDHDAGQPLPGNAHFTILFGATHPAGSPLWEEGGIATLGVEEVAETGITFALRGEIDDLVSQGLAGELVGASALGGFPRTRRGEFTATVEHSSVSALSMIAPSPDWFVGVSDVSLRDENGWLDEVVVDLHPYDAGTEDGSGFSLDNNISSPIETISRRGSPFADGATVGRITFTFIPEAGGAAGGITAVGMLGAIRRRVRRRVESTR